MINAHNSTTGTTVSFKNIAEVRAYVRNNQDADLSWDAGNGSTAFCRFDFGRPIHTTRMANGYVVC
jgi:hypothetical protein